MTSWIFQGNPKSFQVDEYLRPLKIITWTVRQEHLKDEISVGDEVYIWRSDGRKPKSGGIVAKGEIITAPEVMLDDAPELWIEKPRSPYALRVKIRLQDVRLAKEQGMLRRIELERDEQLRDMRISKVRVETNYKLAPAHANHIRRLWGES
jgi:hypothetical protein